MELSASSSEPGALWASLLMGVRGPALEIQNFAVDRALRRRGFGSTLIDSMISALAKGRGEFIRACVAEGNLVAQLFFKSVGFVVETTVRAETYNARMSPGDRMATQDALIFRYPPGEALADEKK